MSNLNKHSKNQIKESFNNIKRKAPEGLWSSISNVTDLNDSEFAIRESFKNQEKTAPLKSWDNVKKQIIIDDVWDNIVLQEDKRKKRFFWWFSSASILLILISVSLFNSWNKDEQSIANRIEGNKELINDNQNSIESEIQDINSESKNIINTENENIDQTIDGNSVNEYTQNSEANSPNLKNGNIQDKLDNLTTPNNNTLSQPSLIERESMSAFVLIQKIPIKEIQMIPFHMPELELISIDTQTLEKHQKYEIGIQASIGNSWVFNNEVKKGFNRQSLINNQLSLGYSVGTIFNYNFNNRSGLEIGYDFYSITNQGYNIYSEGRYDHRHIKFSQQKITLSYKHRFIPNPLQGKVFVFKSGLYYSHSIKEETSVNWVENTANSAYTTFDYGLNVALGIEHKMKHFKFEYGVKTDVGLYNITANSLNLPKKFNYTTTYILGGYVSFRYLF